MKTLIDQFIDVAVLHTKQLKLKPEDYKENNKLAKKLNQIGDKIEKSDSFIGSYLTILKDYPFLGGSIGIRLKNYDLEFSKMIYQYWYNSNPNENWQGKFALSYWEKHQINTENKVSFEKWKNDNFKQYQEFMRKLDNSVK